MPLKNSADPSRRRFLRNTSVLGLGTVALAESGLLKLGKALGWQIDQIVNPDLTCEIIRSQDLLHLKYFFYNANFDGRRLRPEDKKTLYIYVRIPPQHISEQIAMQKTFATHAEIRRHASFISEPSWLAFKLKTASLRYTAEELLDWKKNFSLITLDDMVEKNSPEEYAKAIARMDKDFKNITERTVAQTWHNKPAPETPLPLTKFEVPYKLFLSPIAAPAGSGESRATGEHLFTENNELQQHYRNAKEGLLIVKPWENRLMFADLLEQLTAPRFKAVKWGCTDEADKNTLLMPYPVYRYEINELTMRPEPDRDIASKFFKISALGATADLKYRNDDPSSKDNSRNYSLVAWEQKMVLGRDYFISVTFRAVDVFTGIKLLVSILSRRTYSQNVSFMPLEYYIEYAEKEKTYNDPVVVSNNTFVKIVPDSAGAFCTPRAILNNRAYKVCEPELPAADCKTELDFPYTGFDKGGKAHKFVAKIVFIPAESYTIDSTETYRIPDGSRSYGKGENVPMEHIGWLNPARQRHMIGEPNPCPQTNDKYIYVVSKVFSSHTNAQTQLSNLLNDLKKYVLDNFTCYKIAIRGEMTYARIEGLRRTAKIHGQSSASTYRTRDIILLSLFNPVTPEPDLSKAKDLFLSAHPVRAALFSAEILVSQIEQMEGRSDFKTFAFAKDYRDSRKEMDEQPDSNKSFLLFEMIEKINDEKLTSLKDFFSANYRNGGAMVNPGIDISHVSVRDEGIIYKPEHNKDGLLFKSAASVQTAVNASSVFGNLKAEILGIPILQIIESFLPVADLPAFKFLQQANESFQTLQSLAGHYASEIDKWKRDYDVLVNDLQNWQTKIRNIEQRLSGIDAAQFGGWIRTINDLQREYDELIAKELLRVKMMTAAYLKSLKALKSAVDAKLSNADTVLNELFSNFSIAAYQSKVTLFTAARYTEKDFKESVKIYLINRVWQNPADLERIAAEIVRDAPELPQQANAMYNALREAVTEALHLQEEYLSNKRKQIEDQIKTALDHIPLSIEALLSKLKLQKEFADIISKAGKAADLYRIYYERFEQLSVGHYAKICADYNVNFDPAVVEAELRAVMQSDLVGLYHQLDEIPYAWKAQYKALLDAYVQRVTKVDFFSNYLTYKKELETQIEAVLKPYENILKSLQDDYDTIVKGLAEALTTVRDLRYNIDGFIKQKIKSAEQELAAKLTKLAGEVRGTDAYKEIEKQVRTMQGLLSAVKQAEKQELRYNFNTAKFKRAKVGGIIEFLPKPGATRLDVDVRYMIEFDLQNFSEVPTIKKQSFITDSSLWDFKIGLLNLLYIDFKKVSFVSGSDVTNDFSVEIRSVEFAGCLSFVRAFQDYLNSLTDNLRFEIDTTGAKVSYGVQIPDISAGYFNFFNLSLTGAIWLPFDPNKSMQLHFGIGSDINKFGLTVSGIFGGQGYFIIIAEPKRGIVGMIIVLEFGAIFNLNLTVATGTAYLVGGIYIQKYLGKYDIRGYILCVGRLNILSLFSATVTFYLGLEGDGNVLYGRCVVKVSKRFSRFFEISVKCSFYKQIKGGATNARSSEDVKLEFFGAKRIGKKATLTENLPVSGFYGKDQKLSFRFTDALIIPNAKFLANKYTYTLTREGAGTLGGSTRISGFNRPGITGTTLKTQLKIADLTEGTYEIKFDLDGYILSQKFTVFNTAKKTCPTNGKADISTKEYYSSYYFES